MERKEAQQAMSPRAATCASLTCALQHNCLLRLRAYLRAPVLYAPSLYTKLKHAITMS